MIFTSVFAKNFGVLGELRAAIPLEPGLTVIHGPNESGKSTLVAALRAALTLRHRVGGDVRQRLAYVPRGGGVPEVKVGFEHTAIRYEVEKRFAAQRGTARLKVWHPDGRMEDLVDNDAEARLQQVLGVTPGADGKRDEELGVLPLLWVRQERAALLPSADLNESGRQSLSDVLGRMSGELLGGPDAERLFEAAREQRDRFFTPTGQARRASDSPLYAPGEALRSAIARRDALEGRKAEHEALIDRQDQITIELDKLVSRIPQLEARERETAARAESLRALREQVSAARRTVELAANRASDARRRWDERTLLLSKLSEERELAERLKAEAVAAREAAQSLPQLIADREAARQAAELDEARQKRLWERADAHLEVIRLRAEVDRKSAELERARALTQELAEGRHRLGALKIDPAQVGRLESLERQADVAGAALEAASARVSLSALAEVGVLVGDRPLALSAGESWSSSLSRTTRLRISELVEIEIQPGGKDLDALRRRVEDATQGLAAALAALSVGSVHEARTLAEERRSLAQHTDQLSRQLEAYGQGGPDAIGRALEQLRAQLLTREKVRSAATRDGDPALPSEPVAANAARAEATAARERARMSAQNARDALATQERERVSRDAERVRTEERARESATRLGQLGAQLARQQAEQGDEATLKRLAYEAGELLARERTAQTSLEASLEALQPTEVEAAQSTAARALAEARDSRGALERQRAEILGALSAADLVGLHDRLLEARAAAEAADEQVRRLTESAESSRLLYETLDHARNEARERYLGPLQDETARMLRLLFQDATPIFDDQLNLTQLNRSDSDTFDVLSVGTREQVGVITRLAMARVLARSEPVPVILDDALVATDEARFARMIPVFADAARHHQILLLTCHWSRYKAIAEVADRVIDLSDYKR